jgi:hypothetical protein
MIAALLLLANGRTLGLLLFGASSVAGAIGVVRTVTMLDTNPSYAGQFEYWSSTVGAAAATLPGFLLGIVVVAAFVPRMIRFSPGG